MKTAKILLVILAVALVGVGIAAAVSSGDQNDPPDQGAENDLYDPTPDQISPDQPNLPDDGSDEPDGTGDQNDPGEGEQGGRPDGGAPEYGDIEGSDPSRPASAALSDDKIGWGIGSSKNELSQPSDAVNAQQKYGGLGAKFINGTEKEIVLTFDLGYENGYTEKILDAMSEHGVKGIFFITQDYLDEAPDVVERIIREGHILGNHTVHHPSMPDISAAKAESEITELHQRIIELFGYEMSLFRFPRGEFSERTLQIVDSLGYESWFWSFAYRDWETDNQPDPASSLERVVSSAHPGAIYLLHAVSSTNAQIMGDIITRLEAEGYNFVIPGSSAGAGGGAPNKNTEAEII